MDSEQVAAAAVWLDQYSAASERMKTRAEQLMAAAWLSFDGWYDTELVNRLSKQLAGVSTDAQRAATGLASEYVRQVLGIMEWKPALTARAAKPQPIRDGLPLDLVYTRPAEAFRKAIATGSDEQEAVERAVQRATGLVRTDLSLVERQAEQEQAELAGVTHYRRVIRPELSESGSCGLCVAASDRIYTIRNLMPIHPPNCKCKTMPIADGNDPGVRINAEDLKRLYKAAGSTSGDDLKRVRVSVNDDGSLDVTNARIAVHQHGELGPILARKGDEFRSQQQVPLEKDPARAARMLEKTLPVLDGLEARAAAGEDVTGPLGYQRDLVDKLRRIAA